MPALKLTIVISMHKKPHNRNLTHSSPSSTMTAAAAITTSCITSTVTPANYSGKWTRGWTINPCAPLLPPVHFNSIPYKKLGFRGQVYSYSSEMSSGIDVSPTSPLKSHNDRRQKSPSEESQAEKLLTLPTILTIGRVAAVPLLLGNVLISALYSSLLAFYVDSWWGTTATTGIFIAASITDWLDGYLARKMKLGTTFGAFLDPVADKLMVAATLVLLCTRPSEFATFGQVPWLLPIPAIAIIGREITMSAVREWAASQDSKLLEAVAVNNLGKWKTATQMTALTILLATRDSSLSGAGTLVVSGVVLLYISTGLALWSLAVYMRKIWKVLLM